MQGLESVVSSKLLLLCLRLPSLSVKTNSLPKSALNTQAKGQPPASQLILVGYTERQDSSASQGKHLIGSFLIR